MDSTTVVPSPVGIASHERPAAKRSVIDGALRIVRRLMAALERSRQRRTLAALNDHLLYDVGLTREESLRWTSRRQPRD